MISIPINIHVLICLTKFLALNVVMSPNLTETPGNSPSMTLNYATVTDFYIRHGIAIKCDDIPCHGFLAILWYPYSLIAS